MSAPFERMELLVGSPGAGLALPGRLQKLLMETLSIRAEEVGVIEPIERGRVSVEIALARSRRLSTPVLLLLTFVSRFRLSFLSLVLVSDLRAHWRRPGQAWRPASSRNRSANSAPVMPSAATTISVSSPATVPMDPSRPVRSSAEATT